MISVVILTKNEEKNIFDCLETVLWADEVIVVDDYSTDRTEEVIKNLNSEKVKILKHSLEGDFSSQRNYGLERSKNEWILFIDADERVSTQLRQEINDFLIEEKNERMYEGMLIQRRDVMWGKRLEHGEVGSIKILRLGRKSSGKWIGKVHEVWNVEGKIGEFENKLMHYPHQVISEFLKEINFYTTLRAKELLEKGEKASLVKIILYPKAKFLLNFIIKLGFLDGIEGFIFAILMSFHSFLVRAKLWIYSNEKN